MHYQWSLCCLVLSQWYHFRQISQISAMRSQLGKLGVYQLTHWPLESLNEIFRYVIFKQILVIDGWGISCEIALRWMSLNLTDDKSTSLQVMAWCHQPTSYYLSQYWPTSLSPYGVTRIQWVKDIWSHENARILRTPLASHSTHCCLGPFCLLWSTLIQAWISNYIHYKVWDEIIFLFTNFKCKHWRLE